jgi:hypothetical protein
MTKQRRELTTHTVMDDTAAITAFRSAGVRKFPAQNKLIQVYYLSIMKRLPHP